MGECRLCEGMMKVKICPLKLAGSFANSDKETDFHNECIEALCQWWTSAYTTEGFTVYDCAMVIGAKSNSEGKIPV